MKIYKKILENGKNTDIPQNVYLADESILFNLTLKKPEKIDNQIT